MYPLTFTAHNGSGPDAVQTFTLTVNNQAGGAVYYYFSDQLGTSRVVTNSSGIVCYDADFYPFGGERMYTSTCDPDYKFTGKERDPESDLDNFGARYDSSLYGRFMSPDWSGKPQGVPYAEFGDPQTLNLYAYVRNNPIGKADIDGHEQLCYCELDYNKNSPMSAFSPQETQIEKGLLELASAVFTGSEALEAFNAGKAVTAAIGAIAASGLGTSGLTRIVGTAAGGKPEKVEEGAEAVTTITNPAGMAVTIGTKGNLKAGAVASDISSAASIARHPSSAAKDPTGTALTLGSVAHDVKSGLSGIKNMFSSPPPPPPPAPPRPPTLESTQHTDATAP